MQIIADRRALHRIPELDKDLPKTLAYLRGALAPLACKVFSPTAGALCAFFDFGAEKAIAFRADADALPIAEKTGAGFASTHPGCMHACGHDGHMAILLELARRLDQKKALSRNVLLVFQPAEETTGGAKDLCDTGIFGKYRAEAIFGLHIWPGLEKGIIASRKNEMMSRSCEVKVDVFGKAAHIAKASEGIDALSAGVAFYQKAKAAEAALPQDIFRVLNFGKLESGTVCNVISGHTRIEGTLRTFREDVFTQLQQAILAAAEETEAETGCRVSVQMSSGYPALINPAPLFDKVFNFVPFALLDAPSLTTEDFSWYQKALPGLFFFLGAGDTPALHADTFDFDEDILCRGADFFEAIAENYQ